MNESLKKQFCVIGDPIGHSLSPQIHGMVFRHLGLDYDYIAVHIRKEELADFIYKSKINSRPGFNVTIPHKQNIIPFLDELDPFASRIGAVNTVINRDGKLKGYNTDVPGFLFALSNNGWAPKGPVVILGAGGASRAAFEALASTGVKTITISDVISERLFEYKRHFKQLHPDVVIIVSTKDRLELKTFIENADLLVNATPVGMWPKIDEIPIEPGWLSGTITVFDMVPRPIVTELIRTANSKGLKTIPGLHMLIEQAIESDRLYLNRNIPRILFNSIETELHDQLEENAKP